MDQQHREITSGRRSGRRPRLGRDAGDVHALPVVHDLHERVLIEEAHNDAVNQCVEMCAVLSKRDTLVNMHGRKDVKARIESQQYRAYDRTEHYGDHEPGKTVPATRICGGTYSDGHHDPEHQQQNLIEHFSPRSRSHTRAGMKAQLYN